MEDVAGTRANGEAVWPAPMLTHGQRSRVGIGDIPLRPMAVGHPTTTYSTRLPLAERASGTIHWDGQTGTATRSAERPQRSSCQPDKDSGVVQPRPTASSLAGTDTRRSLVGNRCVCGQTCEG